MKSLKFLGVFFCAALLCSSAVAEESVSMEEGDNGWKPSLELSADYSSVYISKGNISNPDPILTLDAKIELKGFYADVTSMMDMSGYNNPERSGSYTNNIYNIQEGVDNFASINSLNKVDEQQVQTNLIEGDSQGIVDFSVKDAKGNKVHLKYDLSYFIDILQTALKTSDDTLRISYGHQYEYLFA